MQYISRQHYFDQAAKKYHLVGKYSEINKYINKARTVYDLPVQTTRAVKNENKI